MNIKNQRIKCIPDINKIGNITKNRVIAKCFEGGEGV